MNKDSSPTPDSNMPPIPTFSFGQEAPEPIKDTEPLDEEETAQASGDPDNQQIEVPEKPSTPKVVTQKKPSNKKGAKVTPIPDNLPLPFSTEVRLSVQTDLAIISRERKDARRKDYAIKQLLHEAILLLIESPEMTEATREKKIKLMQFPERDQFISFNNRINYDLDVKFRKLKRSREDVRHPYKTIIALTEEALINWIPLQKEFSVEKRNERLAVLAA